MMTTTRKVEIDGVDCSANVESIQFERKMNEASVCTIQLNAAVAEKRDVVAFFDRTITADDFSEVAESASIRDETTAIGDWDAWDVDGDFVATSLWGELTGEVEPELTFSTAKSIAAGDWFSWRHHHDAGAVKYYDFGAIRLDVADNELVIIGIGAPSVYDFADIDDADDIATTAGAVSTEMGDFTVVTQGSTGTIPGANGSFTKVGAGAGHARLLKTTTSSSSGWHAQCALDNPVGVGGVIEWEMQANGTGHHEVDIGDAGDDNRIRLFPKWTGATEFRAHLAGNWRVLQFHDGGGWVDWAYPGASNWFKVRFTLVSANTYNIHVDTGAGWVQLGYNSSYTLTAPSSFGAGGIERFSLQPSSSNTCDFLIRGITGLTAPPTVELLTLPAATETDLRIDFETDTFTVSDGTTTSDPLHHDETDLTTFVPGSTSGTSRITDLRASWLQGEYVFDVDDDGWNVLEVKRDEFADVRHWSENGDKGVKCGYFIQEGYAPLLTFKGSGYTLLDHLHVVNDT